MNKFIFFLALSLLPFGAILLPTYARAEGDVVFAENNYIPNSYTHKNCTIFITRASALGIDLAESTLLDIMSTKGYYVKDENGVYNSIYGFDSDAVYGVYNKGFLLAWIATGSITSSDHIGDITETLLIKNQLISRTAEEVPVIQASVYNVKNPSDYKSRIMESIGSVVPPCIKMNLNN